MHLTIKLTITGQNTFVDGQKYTFTHKTIPLEAINYRYIGKSRIDGFPIFRLAKSVFAIIRTEEMKRQNLYRFKLLKQRDGDFLKSQVKLNLNPTYLTLENDQFLDA